VKLPAKRPLSALLSQALVAFTIEFDNEFERGMGDSGYPGALLSMLVWMTVIRFVAEAGLSVRELTVRTLTPRERVVFMLGCLERWGFVRLETNRSEERAMPLKPHRRAGRILRDGWGSGRGIRPDWIVRLTAKGVKAVEIWRPLADEIEQRWQERFGKTRIDKLREAMQAVVSQLDVDLPWGLNTDWRVATTTAFPPRAVGSPVDAALPVLFSKLLLAFTIEFNGASPTPLALCANTLRVLSGKPIGEREIPRLTGASPETSGVGWEIRRYVAIEPDPTARRGKVVRLTPLGLKAQQTYFQVVGEIEKRWGERFGTRKTQRIRESLEGLFEQQEGGRAVLSKGLIPPPGVVRAGIQAPALGRGDVGVAARKRARELVIQTEAFLSDPSGALPHYPLWDMNRGFGP
jgi:DNA-binding MarR family transcriptional regulator